MKKGFLLLLFAVLAAGVATAQVDVERRRVLLLQSGFAVGPSQERLGGFGFFWFNENHCPWSNTVLRVIFAGIYGDAELSWFPQGAINTAVGVGLGGGTYINSIHPYAEGRRLYAQEFEGDIVNARLFVNQTIPNPTPLPLNVRLTYAPGFQWFRATENTHNFDRPRDFLNHAALGEVRLGGIEPGVTKCGGLSFIWQRRRVTGAGLIILGRSAHRIRSTRIMSAFLRPPVAIAVWSGFVGGTGAAGIHRADVLNAWKLGGNNLGDDDFSMPLHGYYCRELYAESVFITNLDIGIPLLNDHRLVLHFYADNACAKPLDARTGVVGDWQNYLGVGAGIGFRAFGATHLLLSYGYGVNAVRYDRHGGHEIGITLEKSF
ncbi:MAG: hypothetical protein N3B01_10730 [Verrucomicrobiae bacterium]|nr:hypothetical protein [Verrucomicrobiae bacterium]